MEPEILSDEIFQFSSQMSTTTLPDQGKASFRDIIHNSKIASPLSQIAKKLTKISFINGDQLLPQFILADSYLQDLSRSWEDGHIIKLLGKHILFATMREGLNHIWKPLGLKKLMDIDNG